MARELSPTTLNILNILNDCNVHAGTDIAEALSISRTAVWKVIQRLKDYNIAIESQHQGYQLNALLLLLDKHKIESLIKKLGVTLECFETIDSTNDYLRNGMYPKNLRICLAEHESKGRGRMGRAWAAPFGRNIYCSFSYAFNKDISEMAGLSLVIGILIATMLESLDPHLKPLLKWPNDIYANHQKIGGILIDLIAEANGNCRAIIGVGLNINMRGGVLEGVDQPWTSLEHLLNVQLDRNVIVAQLINAIVKGMDLFAEKGLEPFLSDWKRYDMLENKQISVSRGTEILSGIARGVTPQGYLRVELPSGEIQNFSCGDTTLSIA